MKKKISLFLILICSTLCACSAQKDESVVATETPKAVSEVANEENLISTPMSTEEPEDAGKEKQQDEDGIADEMSPEEKLVLERYQEAVTKLAEENVFPNGQLAEPYVFVGEQANNYYKIIDIDRDGRQELIIHYPDASCMAAMSYYIFEYDTESGQFHQELAEFPAVQIFENGILIAKSSHNHGKSNLDDFWPYTVY